jgi:4-carboxymuconolactone decarboxylase
MTDSTDKLGGRLPLVDPATLTGAQRDVFDRLMTTFVPWANDVGVQATTRDGRLIGPFNSALINPAISAKFLELQFAEVANTHLNERVRQVVILAVGAVWRADYELYAHSAAARKAGISEGAIKTLVGGGIPDELTEDETIAGRVARQLTASHRVDDDLYRKAENAFGIEGLGDIATLVGIYHGVSTTLTMFNVPAPE